MKTIGIIGYKKSGKTTLILKLAEELIKRGYRVAAIKHTNERIDKPNTDTSRYQELLSQVAAIDPEETVIFLKGKKNLEEIIPYWDMDIVLIEGFKGEKTFPKIVCLREESEKAQLFDGLQLCTAGFASPSLPVKSRLFDFNILEEEDIKKMADMAIEKSFKLPNLNCRACGYLDCYSLAQEIVKGNKTINDCLSLKPSTLVKVDGKIISMNPFISQMVESTIAGLLSPLKGFTKGNIEIKIEKKIK